MRSFPNNVRLTLLRCITVVSSVVKLRQTERKHRSNQKRTVAFALFLMMMVVLVAALMVSHRHGKCGLLCTARGSCTVTTCVRPQIKKTIVLTGVVIKSTSNELTALYIYFVWPRVFVCHF